jgi:hypothetical protein
MCNVTRDATQFGNAEPLATSTPLSYLPVSASASLLAVCREEEKGWPPPSRVPASRGQRNAATAPHSSCLPALALCLLLLLLLLLRHVKATRYAGARRPWSPSRMRVLVIRSSRRLHRRTSQWQKRMRRFFVAPSP